MKTALYRHWSAEEELLYIGISLQPLARLKQHKCKAHWFEEIASTTIEWFSSRDDASTAERLAIRNEKPAYNIVYNKRRAAPKVVYNKRRAAPKVVYNKRRAAPKVVTVRPSVYRLSNETRLAASRNVEAVLKTVKYQRDYDPLDRYVPYNPLCSKVEYADYNPYSQDGFCWPDGPLAFSDAIEVLTATIDSLVPHVRLTEPHVLERHDVGLQELREKYVRNSVPYDLTRIEQLLTEAGNRLIHPQPNATGNSNIQAGAIIWRLVECVTKIYVGCQDRKILSGVMNELPKADVDWLRRRTTSQ